MIIIYIILIYLVIGLCIYLLSDWFYKKVEGESLSHTAFKKLDNDPDMYKFFVVMFVVTWPYHFIYLPPAILEYIVDKIKNNKNKKDKKDNEES